MQSPKIETKYFDQLVTGHVVMDDVFIHSGNPKRGTVLGARAVAGSAVAAEKSITFTGGSPGATKKVSVTIGGVKFEYAIVATNTVTDIAAGLKAAINNASTGSALVTADNTSGKLELTAKTAGYAGNNITIVAAAEDGSGVTCGDLTVETIGQDEGQELFQIVDSDNAVSELQKPKAVLLEDATAGHSAKAAFCGEFDESKLVFDTGDSLATFKDAMRARGMYAKKIIG